MDNDRDFVPDCDLTNSATQGPTQTGSQRQVDTCNAPVGVNANFYRHGDSSKPRGSGRCPVRVGQAAVQWEFSLSGQQELNRGIAVYGGVFWRWFGNFLVTDNTTGSVADYTPFSVTPGLIPTSPPSAGGESLPSDINTTTFYNINPGVVVNNLTGLSKTMFPDSNVYDRWFGYDVGLNARLPQGIIFQGGLSTGHQTTDFCDVQDPAKAGNSALVEMLASPPVGQFPSSLTSCHMEQNWLPQVKFLGSYTIPKIDVQVGASFQSIPGVEYAAPYAAPNTDLARPVSQGGLGRLPSGGIATGTTTVNLVQPGSLYGPRFNQIDARFGKVIRMGRTRGIVSLDLFNVLNSDTISNASPTYAIVAGATRCRGAAAGEGLDHVRLLVGSSHRCLVRARLFRGGPFFW